MLAVDFLARKHLREAAGDRFNPYDAAKEGREKYWERVLFPQTWNLSNFLHGEVFKDKDKQGI